MSAFTRDTSPSGHGGAVQIFGVNRLLFVVTVVLFAFPAAAQTDPGAAKKFSGFLCQIELVGNTIGGPGYNFTGPSFISNPIPRNTVYSLLSNKLCANSQSNENIKLDCAAKIPGWVGGTIPAPGQPQLNVTCQVGGAACGVTCPANSTTCTRGDRDDLLVAVNNSLTIDAAGNAVLTCQVK